MIRFCDIVFSALGLVIVMPLIIFLACIIWCEGGQPIFSQERVGRNGQVFTIYKLRTLPKGTKAIGTHLIPRGSVSPLGSLLRRMKLDELPQLWCVLSGDMSLVGPRPSLPSQDEVIRSRAALGVLEATPGITGLAQLRRIDMSTPQLLAQTDAEMLRTLHLVTYLRILVETALGRGTGDSVV